MSGVLLYVLLLLLELMVLILFSASGDERVLFREDADDAGCDFVVGDGLVVFADDVHATILSDFEFVWSTFETFWAEVYGR